MRHTQAILIGLRIETHRMCQKTVGVTQSRARKAIQIKGMLTTSCSRTKFVFIPFEQGGANMGDLADMFTQTQGIRILT